MTRPILILGDTPRVAVPVARSLHRCGVPVDVATLNASGSRITSHAVRRHVHLLAHGGGQEEALAHLVAEQAYDLLMPITDRALGLACTTYDTICTRVCLGCPEPEVVRRVLDKGYTLAVAEGLGLAVPRSYLVEDGDELEALRGQLRFPALIKDRTKTRLAESTFKVRYFGDHTSLEAAFRRDPTLAGRVVIQEYLPGEDIGLGVLMHRGELLTSFQYRSLRDLPYTGGVTVLAVSEPVDPELRRGALALLRALEWEGVAMVEYRRDPASGRATLLEVNGRYWGSVSLAIRAGIDLPLYAWQLAHGQHPEIPTSYQVGLSWRWTAGYLQRLHGLLIDPKPEGLPRSSWRRELSDLPRAFSPSVVSAMGSPGDPVPGVVEVVQTASGLMIARLRNLAARLLPRSMRDWFRRPKCLHPATIQQSRASSHQPVSKS